MVRFTKHFLRTRRRRIATRGIQKLSNNYLSGIGIERQQIPQVVEDLLDVAPPRPRRRTRRDDWHEPLDDARWAMYAARSSRVPKKIA